MGDYVAGVFTFSFIYLIATVGLAIFTGFTGLFSLGHAAFVAIGAYTAGILTYYYGVNFYLALLAAGVVSGFVGLLIGYPTLKAKLRSDYFAISTLGFGEAVRVLLENLDFTQGARGLPGIAVDTTLPVVLFISAGVLWLARNFVLSRFGRAAVAVREDFTAAEMMGIDLFRVRIRSLIFSAVTAGLAGGLFAHYVGFIQPSMFAAALSTQLTAGVVAGGMGSISGPAIAAVLFVAIPEVLRVASMWRLVAYGFLLVAIMVYRPQGLMGHQELSWSACKAFWRKIRAA